MDTPVAVEQIRAPEKLPLRKKAGRLGARLLLAGICILPAADFAVADGVAIKALQVSQDKISMQSDFLERSAETGILGSVIFGQSFGLGYVISRNKKFENLFGEYGNYLKVQQEKMRLPRKLLSKTVHLPYKAMESVSNGIKNAGERISNRESKYTRSIGKFAMDLGLVNTIGPSFMITQEAMDGHRPDLKRVAKLSGLIAGSWTLIAEAVRGIYRSVDFLRPPMATVGETFVELTSIDVANPLNTPTATAFLGSIATGLAVSGWNMAKFHEQREQNLAPQEA